jgi:hypothetical protein
VTVVSEEAEQYTTYNLLHMGPAIILAITTLRNRQQIVGEHNSQDCGSTECRR